MKSKLELVVNESRQEGSFGLGIRMAISQGNREEGVLIIRECASHEELKQEVDECKKALDQLLADAEAIFEEQASAQPGEIGAVWEALQNAADDETFVSRFNALGEDARIELAEYVLTTQNIFKGFASVFSKRYEEQSHTLS